MKPIFRCSFVLLAALTASEAVADQHASASSPKQAAKQQPTANPLTAKQLIGYLDKNDDHQIVCESELGGLLKSYHRAA